MSRKSVQVILIAACFVVGISGMASGAQIQGSRHDFSLSGDGTNFGGGVYELGNTGIPVEEICVFCHTPHNASSAGFLWNRTNLSSTAYNMYTSSTLTTAINMGITGLSLMCMSCHDGITGIAVSTLINAPYSESGDQVKLVSGFDKIGQLYKNDALKPGWGANIGNLIPGATVGKVGYGTVANLTDDHPVAFAWVTGIGGIIPPIDLLRGSWPTGAELKLFNGRMECSTCHDVHNSANQPFLRMSNTNSNMCLACHIK